MIHDVRDHPARWRPQPPQAFGSDGCFPGPLGSNTLVVETTNFNGRIPIAAARGGAAQFESSENLK